MTNTLTSYDLIDLGMRLKVRDANNNETQVGKYVGISDQKNKCWKFALYLGNETLLVLYEKGKGTNVAVFEKLKNIKPLTKESLTKSVSSESFSDSENRIDLKNLSDQVYLAPHMEYFIYAINLFDTSSANSVKAEQTLDVLKYNLDQIESLDEGDVIAFERSFYEHHALLTDVSRMIVTHRSGEPENPGNSFMISSSLLGLPTEKALVSEDFLMDVADYRKLYNSNHKYDSRYPPRDKEEIVKEAKSRIGERGYSVRNLNCQHLASECRNGTSYSPEVEGVIAGMKVGAVVLGGLIMGTAALAYNKTRNKQKREEEKES